jgi:hypothetical protein
MGPIRCPETSVKDYHSRLHNTPEQRRSHGHRGGSLKSHGHRGGRLKSRIPTPCLYCVNENPSTDSDFRGRDRQARTHAHTQRQTWYNQAHRKEIVQVQGMIYITTHFVQCLIGNTVMANAWQGVRKLSPHGTTNEESTFHTMILPVHFLSTHTHYEMQRDLAMRTCLKFNASCDRSSARNNPNIQIITIRLPTDGNT